MESRPGFASDPEKVRVIREKHESCPVPAGFREGLRVGRRFEANDSPTDHRLAFNTTPLARPRRVSRWQSLTLLHAADCSRDAVGICGLVADDQTHVLGAVQTICASSGLVFVAAVATFFVNVRDKTKAPS